MIMCADCGLLVINNDIFQCYKFKTKVEKEEASTSRNCRYFCRPKSENGEQLPPFQLLLLKEAELKRKKMKGPV